MGDVIELSEESSTRIEANLSEGETAEQFVEELLNHYEAEGNTLWEGYGGEPRASLRGYGGRPSVPTTSGPADIERPLFELVARRVGLAVGVVLSALGVVAYHVEDPWWTPSADS